MGLLDTLISTVTSVGGQKQIGSNVLETVVDLFKEDGVKGIVDLFKSKGLEDVVSSWVGTGDNMPVSVDQLKDVLGEDKIRALAEKAGISEDDSSGMLKDLLPEIIDKISPGGSIDFDD